MSKADMPWLYCLSTQAEAGQLPVCSGCFSVAVIRHSVQDNLEKEEFILADRSRRIESVRAGRHISTWQAGWQEQGTESWHLIMQAQSREKEYEASDVKAQPQRHTSSNKAVPPLNSANDWKLNVQIGEHMGRHPKSNHYTPVSKWNVLKSYQLKAGLKW